MLSLITFHCYDAVFSFLFWMHMFLKSLYLPTVCNIIFLRDKEMDNLVFIPLEGLFDI